MFTIIQLQDCADANRLATSAFAEGKTDKIMSDTQNRTFIRRRTRSIIS
jgi:hypothetical protein